MLTRKGSLVVAALVGLATLGNALKYAGRSEAAEAAIRKSVAVRPSFGEGWWSLANMKSARFESRDLAMMRKALKGPVSADDALRCSCWRQSKSWLACSP